MMRPKLLSPAGMYPLPLMVWPAEYFLDDDVGGGVGLEAGIDGELHAQGVDDGARARGSDRATYKEELRRSKSPFRGLMLRVPLLTKVEPWMVRTLPLRTLRTPAGSRLRSPVLKLPSTRMVLAVLMIVPTPDAGTRCSS